MLKRLALSTLAILLLATPQYYNAVYYETREVAIRDGHRPCKVCKP